MAESVAIQALFELHHHCALTVGGKLLMVCAIALVEIDTALPIGVDH